MDLSIVYYKRNELLCESLTPGIAWIRQNVEQY